MKNNYMIAALVSTAVMLYSVASQAATLQLSVFENLAGDFSGTVAIEQVDANTVTTTFSNTSLADGPIIGSLYFESGAADWISDPVWTNTVTGSKKQTGYRNWNKGNKSNKGLIKIDTTSEDQIAFRMAKKAKGAPGGQNIDWPVSHRQGATSYQLKAVAPGPVYGLNSGEVLQIAWELTGDYGLFIASILNGETRFAAHIHDCSYANSCSAITSVTTPEVPVPAAIWLFASGMLGLIGVARSRKTTPLATPR